ncbi:MAG: tetratricopeptide repeat protein [Gemmatimonadaceae bacterium]
MGSRFRRSDDGVFSLVAPVFVAAVTIIAFLPVLRAGFVAWDDPQNFLTNPNYRGLGWQQLAWMWTTFHMGHYVPLSWMTLGLDYDLWQMNPAGYHLTNLIIHCANAVLIYALALELLGKDGRETRDSPHGFKAYASAAIAALFFAVHPLRVESVAWITERRDVLSLFFYLASVVAYIRGATPSNSRVWYSLALIFGAFAMLSKATAMTLPAALLLLEIYPLRRLGGAVRWQSVEAKNVLFGLVPFVLLSAAAAALSIAALHPGARAQLTLGAKVAVSAYSIVFYLLKTLIPVRLSPLYPMPLNVDPLSAVFLAAYCTVITVSGVAWLLRKRFPAVSVAWLAFVIITLPMLGVVQNGPQIAADRYTYHSAAVFALLLGAGIFRLPRAAYTATLGVASAIVLTLGTLTWRQTQVWHDSETLWSRVLELEPNSAVAEYGIGQLRVSSGKIDEGIAHYERGIAIDSSYADVYNNLGMALASRNRFDEASKAYARAVIIRPRFDEAYNNWGVALSQKGDIDGASKAFAQALAINPSLADAQFNWGYALLQSGKPAEAAEHFRLSASLRPGDSANYFNWGLALAHQGKLNEAVAKFREALRIDPNDRDTQEYLAKSEQILAQQANGLKLKE